MQSALPRPPATGNANIDLASEQEAGKIQLADFNRINEAIDEFGKQIVDVSKINVTRLPKAVDDALLIKTLNEIYNTTQIIRTLWEFPQGLRLSILNRYLRTDALGNLFGIEKLPYNDIENAPFALTKLKIKPVGTYSITGGNAGYPVAVSSAAIGANQTGNGSGQNGSIAEGDAWLLSGNTNLTQTIGPDNLAIESEQCYIVAAKDNAQNIDDDWILIEKEPNAVFDSTELVNEINLLKARVNVLEGNAVQPTYSLTRSATNVNEGSSLTITLSTTNVANGVLVPYTITGIQAADLVSQSLTGNFTINNNVATVVLNFANDLTSEGPEILTLTLNSRPENISVIVNDTSITPNNPTYNLTSNVASVNEGSALIITLNTQNVADGVVIPYTITGVATEDISNASLVGNFTILNSTNSITLNVSADTITEGTETLVLTLNGLGVSISVPINDTSMTPNAQLPYTIPFVLNS